MAIDLTGISNVNEFYTQYYLQAVLEGDLKGVFEAWSKLDTTPLDALRQLARSYDSQGPGDDWWYEFFAAFGYPLKPAQWQLADESTLALETELVTSTGAPHLWIVQAPDTEDDPLTAFDDILTKQVFTAPEPPAGSSSIPRRRSSSSTAPNGRRNACSASTCPRSWDAANPPRSAPPPPCSTAIPLPPNPARRCSTPSTKTPTNTPSPSPKT